jgi:hypothetical protein
VIALIIRSSYIEPRVKFVCAQQFAPVGDVRSNVKELRRERAFPVFTDIPFNKGLESPCKAKTRAAASGAGMFRAEILALLASLRLRVIGMAEGINRENI